jgi:hypothetical protein
MDLKCGWCRTENKIKGMVSSNKMPVVCSICGAEMGYIDYKDLNELIKERDRWKKKYFILKNNS